MNHQSHVVWHLRSKKYQETTIKPGWIIIRLACHRWWPESDHYLQSLTMIITETIYFYRCKPFLTTMNYNHDWPIVDPFLDKQPRHFTIAGDSPVGFVNVDLLFSCWLIPMSNHYVNLIFIHSYPMFYVPWNVGFLGWGSHIDHSAGPMSHAKARLLARFGISAVGFTRSGGGWPLVPSGEPWNPQWIAPRMVLEWWVTLWQSLIWKQKIAICLR